MAKAKLTWEKWINRDILWFIYSILFGACPILATMLVEMGGPDSQCCTFFKPLDAISSCLALFVANFNLVALSGKKNHSVKIALILISVFGVFLMGVCTAIVSIYSETGTIFNQVVYYVLLVSIVLSYASNRYVFVYSK
jgi:hypothetical protein